MTTCYLCRTSIREATHLDSAGAPRRYGKRLPNYRKATFVTTTGRQIDLPFCASCLAELSPADYPRFWRRVLDAIERDLVAANARDPDPARCARRIDVMSQVARAPVIGLLGIST